MRKQLLAFICFSFISTKLLGQGCSDAGVCSAGALGSASGEADLNDRITIQQSFGLGEQKVNIHTTQLEFSYRCSELFFLQGKLPFIYTSGNLGANGNIGDPIITANFELPSLQVLVISAGCRIPVNKSDAKTSLPLPMPYQSSLGTFDVLGGLSFKSNHWKFATGVQYPILHKNRNPYRHKELLPLPHYNDYFESFHLKRGGDMILRAERILNLNSKLNAAIGVLGIYRIIADQVKDSNQMYQKVNASKGLTLNITGSIEYNISKKHILEFSAAKPVIIRKERPDGLTRHYVLGLKMIFLL